MGLLTNIFRKKENKKIGKEEEVDSTELTEEDLDKVYAKTPYCPKVNVPPLNLNDKQNEGQIGQKRNDLGR